MTREPEEADLRRKIAPTDVTISRETLLAQAARAEAEGYPQLARNFRRAAELTSRERRERAGLRDGIQVERLTDLFQHRHQLGRAEAVTDP